LGVNLIHFGIIFGGNPSRHATQFADALEREGIPGELSIAGRRDVAYN
jgi:hypothetical protein